MISRRRKCYEERKGKKKKEKKEKKLKRRKNELRLKIPGGKKKQGEAYMTKAKEESKEFVEISKGEVSQATKMLGDQRRTLGI